MALSDLLQTDSVSRQPLFLVRMLKVCSREDSAGSLPGVWRPHPVHRLVNGRGWSPSFSIWAGLKQHLQGLLLAVKCLCRSRSSFSGTICTLWASTSGQETQLEHSQRRLCRTGWTSSSCRPFTSDYNRRANISSYFAKENVGLFLSQEHLVTSGQDLVQVKHAFRLPLFSQNL